VGLEPAREHGDALADVIDVVLDKGLVINADIMVSLAGVELLGIKLQAPAWRAMMPAETRGQSYGQPFAEQLAATEPAHVPAR